MNWFYLLEIFPSKKKGVEEEILALQLIPKLAPLPNERVIKKYYFTLPPEKLVELKPVI